MTGSTCRLNIRGNCARPSLSSSSGQMADANSQDDSLFTLSLENGLTYQSHILTNLIIAVFIVPLNGSR